MYPSCSHTSDFISCVKYFNYCGGSLKLRQRNGNTAHDTCITLPFSNPLDVKSACRWNKGKGLYLANTTGAYEWPKHKCFWNLDFQVLATHPYNPNIPSKTQTVWAILMRSGYGVLVSGVSSSKWLFRSDIFVPYTHFSCRVTEMGQHFCLHLRCSGRLSSLAP